jgi:hypothetical protein
MNNQYYLKTDRETKLSLYADQEPINKSDKLIRQNQQSLQLPKYKTTVDLNTNNIIEQVDKKLTRDQKFQLNEINNKNYTISRINIDSRYRNKEPKNIIRNFIKVNSPFIFVENSNILEIKMPYDHNLNIDDHITITNLDAQIITLRSNTLSLKINNKYLYINHQNHNFLGPNNIISINDVINSDESNYFFGNIPLSIINTEHKVILIDNDGIVDNNNYIIDIGIYSENNFIYTEDSYEISILTYNGVHIKYINASYPIIDNIQQGFHTIIESTNNSIKIQLSVVATTSTGLISIGNNKILIGFISSTINGYPYPDFYNFDLKKTYYKVRKIRLVSTEIPNTELLIKNKPLSLKNNMLYFQILDDGDYIYSIDIFPGNYDTETLRVELINKIENLSRKFGPYIDTKLYFDKCNAEIILNSANNFFSLKINSTIILSRNITIDNSIFDDTNIRIKINHPYHNLNSGDTIKISNAYNIKYYIINGIQYYIPSDIINSTHIIESVNSISNYTIKLIKFNPINNRIKIGLENINDGAGAVFITYPLSIRLLFNYEDTIGSILGFKNISNNNSITKFDKIITNNSNYIYSNNLNSVGLIDTNTPIFNFRTYPYILMASTMFSSNINYRDSIGIFAKLFLTGNPGSMIYDQYVQLIENLPIISSSLNSIDFVFLTPDGIPYNFNGQEHSYTLELYEEFE